MNKGVLMGLFVLLFGMTNAHAAKVTIRGLTIYVPTQNPVATRVYKEGLDALFESCPAIMEYRQDIDHYGIYANIDVHPWNIDSKSFNYFHYKGRSKSGKSTLEQIAEKFGWHGALWVTITTIAHPKNKIFKPEQKNPYVKREGPRQIEFQIGGGKDSGIVMQQRENRFCNSKRVVKVKMPDARKDWGDPDVMLYIPDDNASIVSALF